MKQLFIVLFSTLLISACAHDPYKIDPVATASAPWRVGEVVYDETLGLNLEEVIIFSVLDLEVPIHVSRVFKGITVDGYFLVEEFFESDTIATNPYLISGEDGVEKERPIVHGLSIDWYPTGELFSKCLFDNGTSVEPCVGFHKNGARAVQGGFINGEAHGLYTFWWKNGQTFLKMEFKNDQLIGFYRMWDEEGKLIGEMDFGDLEE